jgi:hypothetical protein
MEKGRPSKYTSELADQICELVATTSKSMRTICLEIGVPYGTHLQWLRDKDDYSSQYACAKEDQADFLSEEMIDIADDSSNDVRYTESGEVINSEFVQRSKLRIDTRKWIASKLKPKKYGDKLDVLSDGKALVSPIINMMPPSE